MVRDQKKLGMTRPYNLGLKAHVICSLSFSKIRIENEK
jgi:hypothetical protein